MVFKTSDTKSSGSATHTEITFESQKLAEQLCKPLTSEFRKRGVSSSFMDTICGTGLADMRLISK